MDNNRKANILCVISLSIILFAVLLLTVRQDNKPIKEQNNDNIKIEYTTKAITETITEASGEELYTTTVARTSSSNDKTKGTTKVSNLVTTKKASFWDIIIPTKKTVRVTTTTLGRTPKTNSFTSTKATTITKGATTTTRTTTIKTTTSPAITSKSNLVSQNGWLNIKNRTLVNNKGNKIQLKGMSTHGMQWYGNFATYDNMKYLRDNWNSNLFRIAMYTNENGYIQNNSIKNSVIAAVDNAIKLDMYVIIDWHILSDNNPQTYQKEAKIFFNEMSKKYANTPNVIYEICNEPNGGTNWNNNIKPYAEDVIKTIRSNSPRSIIIVGTGTWSQDVQDAAANPINDSRVIYSLHFYAGTHKKWLRDRADSALSKIPLFVSEWGTTDASGNGNVDANETRAWVTWMKNNNISWANWSLSDKNESSALLKNGVPNSKISDSYLTTSGRLVKESMLN